MEAAIKANYLSLEGNAQPRDLDFWQPHLVRKRITAEARYAGMRAAGQVGLSTLDLRTDALKERMNEADYQQELEGTTRRITIGKHLDDFTSESE
jgi:hypothetical protein